jgi:glycerol-3-phosphate acyltransferase PlsY
MSIWLVGTAYVIGGIPFAFVLARRWGGTDVRYSGSGNIGATNVLRTTGMSVALAVLALDMSKGYLVMFAARSLGADQVAQGMVAAAVVAGHIFPVWLKFRGGKGVATACGAFAVLAPISALLAVVIFAVVVGLTRYVSLGSMAAALALAPAAIATASSPTVAASALVVSILVLFRHTSNVRRLYAGRERRLGERGI